MILNCQLKNSDKNDELNVLTAIFIYWWDHQSPPIAINLQTWDNLKNSLILNSCLPSSIAMKGIMDVFFLKFSNYSPNLFANLLSPCQIAKRWCKTKPIEVTNVNDVPIHKVWAKHQIIWPNACGCLVIRIIQVP